MLIYKRGKASASRGIGIGALGALLLFGCRELYHFVLDMGWEPLVLPIGGFSVGWADLISGAVAVGCALGIFVLANNHRVVDFLMETEAELKKVSWSPREQLISNSIVVIVSVFVLALFILVADKVVSEAIRFILG